MTPLLTRQVHEQLVRARASQQAVSCSLDLGRTVSEVRVSEAGWTSDERTYPFLDSCKERTIYYWSGADFVPASRFEQGLIKLVPTEWGAPTFEIDGIKMLPTAKVSPYDDARKKVSLIIPRSKRVLDTCGGLGYFAAWCLAEGASHVISFEKNPAVAWLRTLNPWSPPTAGNLELRMADITQEIASLPDRSFDAALHDPPRFGIAGELYSQAFYDQLARVLKRGAALFHYTGTPNKLTSGRDVPREVAKRLQTAGFRTALEGDGILAEKKS